MFGGKAIRFDYRLALGISSDALFAEKAQQGLDDSVADIVDDDAHCQRCIAEKFTARGGGEQ